MARSIRVTLILDDATFQRRLRANEQRLTSIGTTAGNASRSVLGLTGSIQGLAAALGVREFVQFADSVTEINNRFQVLGGTAADVRDRFTAVAAIATESRAPLEAVSDLFFRIARASDQLGISQAQALDITRTLSLALAASGISAAEASGPLLQLGQALQSGVFQGDELRSILEGLPAVSRALAEELNVPIGALRELGSQGVITADIFVRAMQRAKAGIEDAFGDTNATIGQSLNVLRTSLATLFAEFDQSAGATNTLAGAILSIAEDINSLRTSVDRGAAIFKAFGKTVKESADLLLTLLAAFAGFRILRGLFTVVSSFTSSLFAAVRAMGGLRKTVGILIKDFGRFFRRISTGTASTGEAITKFESLRRLFVSLGNRAKFLTDAIGKIVSGVKNLAIVGIIAKFISDFVDNVQDLGSAGTELVDALTDVGTEVEGTTDGLTDMNDTLEDTATQMELLRGKIQQEAGGIVQGQLTELERLRDDLITLMQAENLELEIPNLDTAIERLQNKIQELVQQQAEDNVFDSLSESAQEFSREVPRLLEAAKTPLQELEEDVAAANELFQAGLITSVEDLATVLQQLAEAYPTDEEENPLKQLRADLEALPENFEGLTRGIELLNEALAAGDISLESYNELLRQFKEDLPANAEAIEGFRQSLEGATRTLSQSLAEGLAEGKLELGAFKDFVKTLITDIIKEIIRLQIIQPLISGLFGAQFGAGGSITGFGGGGLFGSLFGGARRLGGPVQKNVPYLVGEMGPELFSPPGAGSIVPNNQLQGQPTQVNYNIQAVDARSFKQLVAQDPEFIYSVTQAGARRLPG